MARALIFLVFTICVPLNLCASNAELEKEGKRVLVAQSSPEVDQRIKERQMIVGLLINGGSPQQEQILNEFAAVLLKPARQQTREIGYIGPHISDLYQRLFPDHKN